MTDQKDYTLRAGGYYAERTTPLGPFLRESQFVSTKGARRIYFWCPGCDAMHTFDVGNSDGPTWTFDGNVESPTFNPSLRYLDGSCHLFVRAGKIEFCSDCQHPLAGKTVSMENV